MALHRDSRLAEARQLFEDLLARLPGHPKLLHRLGLLARQQGDPARSAELIAEAIRARPDAAVYHNNLACAQRDLGRDEDAERAYRRAVELKPDYAGAAHNLALLLAAQGRLAEAETWYRRVLRLDPESVAAQFDLACVLRQQGRFDAAIAALRRVVRRDPNHAAAYNNLGALLHLRAEVGAARACLDRAVALDPRSSQAHFNRARLLEEMGELEAARADYRCALDLGPEARAEVACHLAALERRLCDWDGEDAALRRLTAEIEAFLSGSPRRGLPPLSLNVLALPAPLRLAAARHQARGLERQAADARARCAFAHARRSRDRLRVGYVSPDFRQHAVGTLIHGLFEAHDRGAVEVHAYSLVPHVDDFTRRVQAGCDVFTDVSGESPEQTARRIHADGIDVLVDLAGYTTFSRPAIFALRPAPVQLHWLGYLDTAGADFLPYLLGDERVIDPRVAEHVSEAVVYLPDSFAVVSPLPLADTPSRAEAGLPDGAFVYCCMNALHKVDPAVFGLWMRALARVPDSVLWLVDDTSAAGKANLRREAERRGVAGDRLVFAPRRPLAEYLARYRLADLFLDTTAYNAGATAAGALYAGLPLITLPGTSFMSRMGASLVAAAGIPEAICADPEHYEERAVWLATDGRHELEELRRRLVAARDGPRRAPLFDVPRFARHLEDAFRRLWRDFEAGAGPRPIRVPSLT